MSLTVSFYRMVDGVPSLIVVTKPETTSNIQKKLMGDNVATLSFSLSGMYNFNIGDHATILGEEYYISKPPVILKSSKYKYTYNVVMESRQYLLRNAQYLFYSPTNLLLQADFSLTGTADDFINLLISNANRVGSWVKGGVVVSGYKTLTFSNEDCLSVLGKIADAFETEFYIVGNVIHLAKRQTATSNTFRYGKGQGLYTIDRQLLDENLFTRLYVYGGSQNLPNTYRNFSTRLLMNSVHKCLITDLSAVVTVDTQKHFTFSFTPPLSADSGTTLVIEYRLFGSSGSWTTSGGSMNSPKTLHLAIADYEFRFRTINTVCGSVVTNVEHINATTTQLLYQQPSIIEKNVDRYGVIEGSIIIEDVIPERESTVTAVDVSNPYKFKDTTIDFDINANLLPGLSAKVVFQTGQLAGYKFDISKFDYGTKEFTVLKNKDEKALDIPSATIKQAIGDKYILVDMLLPQAYVDAAERKLRDKATEYINLRSEPMFKYTVVCDPVYFRKMGIVLEVGDIIHLTDIELQVDKDIRIISLTRSLDDEFNYTIDLGDTVEAGRLSAIIAAITLNSSNNQATAQQLNNSALFNGTYIGDFKIEQGTAIIKNMPTASSLTGMKAVYIDADGKLWKAP